MENKHAEDNKYAEENTKKNDAVVAIDFGSSGCAVSYGVLEDGKIVVKKEQHFGQTKSKLPSTLLYDNVNKKVVYIGKKALEKYNQGDPKCSFFQGFKMDLYENKDGKPTSKSIDGTTIETKILLAGMLKYLIDVGRALIYKSEAKSLINLKKEPRILWILTVPAIWHPKNKELMYTVAREELIKANRKSEDLIIALEPECASLWIRKNFSALMQQTKEKDFQWSAGYMYMVADLGGGTADITVHRALDNNRVAEVKAASGKNWGSNYINAEYTKFIQELCGNQFEDTMKQGENKEQKAEVANQWHKMMQNFEAMKKSFGEDSDEKISITILPPFAAVVNQNFSKAKQKVLSKFSSVKNFILDYKVSSTTNEGKLVLNRELFISAFIDPVLDRIKDHLTTLFQSPEIKDKCRHLYFAGGFSQSSFITTSINQHLLEKKINVNSIVCNDIFAIVEGAVLFGFDPSLIDSRISLRTYGCEVSMDYDEKNPLHKGKKLNKVGEKYYVDGAFKTFVKVGQCVGHQEEVTQTVIPLTETQTAGWIKVYESRSSNVEFVTDEGCLHLCTITVDVPRDVPREKRHITITMKFGSTHIQVTTKNHQGNPNENPPFVDFHANFISHN